MYPGKYASLTPNRAAYVMAGSGQVITYTDLERGSNQAAHLFRALGLARGDHLAICLENHPAFLQICWGAFRAGLYFTAISYRLQAEEVEYIHNLDYYILIFLDTLIFRCVSLYSDVFVHLSKRKLQDRYKTTIRQPIRQPIRQL